MFTNLKDLEEGKGLQAAKNIQAFRSFDSLVKSRFGKTLSADYKDRIGQFSKDYRDLNIGISVKFHILKAYVEDFIIFKGGIHGIYLIHLFFQ